MGTTTTDHQSDAAPAKDMWYVGTAYVVLGAGFALIALLMVVVPPVYAPGLVGLPTAGAVLLLRKAPGRHPKWAAAVGITGIAVLIGSAWVARASHAGDLDLWALVALVSGGPTLAVGLWLRRR